MGITSIRHTRLGILFWHKRKNYKRINWKFLTQFVKSTRITEFKLTFSRNIRHTGVHRMKNHAIPNAGVSLTTKRPGHCKYARIFCIHMISRYYFLKKSGILIDCSFTLLVGVLGVSREGDVPPTGRLGIAVAPPALGAPIP